MQVRIKDFNIDMEIKNKGVELEVRDAQGEQQLGDLIITKTQVIWCPGKTTRQNGKKVSWQRFIEMMDAA